MPLFSIRAIKSVLPIAAAMVLASILPAQDAKPNQTKASAVLLWAGVESPAGLLSIEQFLGSPVLVRLTCLAGQMPTPEMRVDVYLDGTALGAPLHKGLPCEFKPMSQHPSLAELSFIIPEIETEKPVILRAVLRGSENAAIGQIRIQMMRRDALRKALQEWQESTAVGSPARLVVFGKVNGLREMLRDWKCDFDDAGKTVPLRVDAKSLAIGDDVGDEQAPIPSLAESSALLFFRRRPLEGGSLRERITPQGVSTVISAPRLEDWRDSPFLHRTLIEHLNQIRASHE